MIDRATAAATPLPPSPPSERAAREPRPARSFETMLGESPTRDEVPGGGAEMEAHEIEMVIQDGDGGGQAIVLPWRLLANDALSQKFADLASDIAGSPASTVQCGGRDARAYAAIARTDAHLGNRLAAAPPVQAVQPVPLASAGNSVSTAASGKADRAAPLQLPVLSEPWQARLLRWFEERDRGLTVRLRDYRLDAGDEARLLDRLQSFAREHGLRLERVLVNAREVWRASA